MKISIADLPEDVVKALRDNDLALCAFNALGPSQRLEYLRLISAARRPRARTLCIRRMIEHFEAPGRFYLCKPSRRLRPG